MMSTQRSATSVDTPHLAWDPLAGGAPAALVQAALAGYRGSARAYHNVEHLQEMLTACAQVERDIGFASPREVFVAALFHDAVYDPTRNDNEAKSAELALETLQNCAIEVNGDRVRELILKTAQHGKHAPRDDNDDESLFLDADMGILAAPAERYRAYMQAIRQEYAHVPDELFRAGRKRFVDIVLASPAIYLSPYFRARLEAAARANVRMERDTLL